MQRKNKGRKEGRNGEIVEDRRKSTNSRRHVKKEKDQTKTTKTDVECVFGPLSMHTLFLLSLWLFARPYISEEGEVVEGDTELPFEFTEHLKVTKMGHQIQQRNAVLPERRKEETKWRERPKREKSENESNQAALTCQQKNKHEAARKSRGHQTQERNDILLREGKEEKRKSRGR